MENNADISFPDLIKEQFQKQMIMANKLNLDLFYNDVPMKQGQVKEQLKILDTIIDQILPHTKAEATCLQKKMIKERNRAMLARMLKTIAENPYERYTFDIKK